MQHSGVNHPTFPPLNNNPHSLRVANHSKLHISYFHNDAVGGFVYGPEHPMKPERLVLTHDLVTAYGLLEKMSLYQPRKATNEEMAAYHDEDYIEFVKRINPHNERMFPEFYKERFRIGGDSSDDCPAFDGMYDFCSLYTGSSLDAARCLNNREMDVAINWSGGLHHAKKNLASGFCYVNDIVLAIMQLLRVHSRVLYIDIDVHHGDGVQEAFYYTDRVMTVSFHHCDGEFFPRSGYRHEIGRGLGKYYSLNVPLHQGIENTQYVAIFRAVIAKVIETFRPDAIVLQCGADSLGKDQLGTFNLSIKAHGECVACIQKLGIPLLVLGGGGYTVENVSRCWAYETAALLQTDVGNQLPIINNYHLFGPDFVLHPDLSGTFENQNTADTLSNIYRGVVEHLRHIQGAPSVQIQDIPPDLSGYESDITITDDEAFETTLIDQRSDRHQNRPVHVAEFYDSEPKVP